MKNIKSVFNKFEKDVRNSSWFDQNWEIYNRGNYLQIFKSNWHNQNLGGVHFETYIESPQIKSKSFPICIHAEEDCPSQQEFIRKFLIAEEERIKSWKGYKIINLKYNICEKIFPLNFKNLEQRLMEEFARLRQLEKTIDQILQEH